VTKFPAEFGHFAPLGQGKHPVAFLKIPADSHVNGIVQVDLPERMRLAVLLFEGSAGYCPLGQVAG
jgi:hypothetical protein